MQEIRVRAYTERPWYKRRVLKMPAGALCALLAFATIVAAAIVALGPFSAPVSQQSQTVFVGTGSAAEPAYGLIEPTLAYGSVDHVLIQAWQAGYTSSVTIHLVVKIQATGGSCAVFAANIADKDGVLGKITLDHDPIGGTYVQLDVASGVISTGGVCTIDAGLQFPAQSFIVTTAMTSAAKGNAFDMAWQYLNPPNANAISWSFQAEV